MWWWWLGLVHCGLVGTNCGVSMYCGWVVWCQWTICMTLRHLRLLRPPESLIAEPERSPGVVATLAEPLLYCRRPVVVVVRW